MPGKQWEKLSPAYRARLSRHGVTAKNYGTPAGNALTRGARGHARTPERPERAQRNPDKYRDYLNKRSEIVRQVIAKKERVFGDRLKYNAQRSKKSVERNPVTKRPVSLRAMMAFLAVPDDDVDEWFDDVRGDDEFAFLFYH